MNTIGGVIQPGSDLVEIVPLDNKLLIEAKIQPRDIAFLHPGQHAMVKFTAYDYTIYGGLQGEVVQISPDTVTDKQGRSFYIVRLQTDKIITGNKRASDADHSRHGGERRYSHRQENDSELPVKTDYSRARAEALRER